MNPGLVVKLRPTGPWRIGSDSGARNQVDFIYHSDSLYAAVTAALVRLGSLEEWLAATARNGAPAVCFGSCFPFIEEIGFVVPPRTLWPPAAPALLAARVRWKSARFVPLGIVPALLASQSLEEDDWTVDGPSGCLVPAGRPGPFRAGIRWNAAVDRLAGSTERHSTACLEFRSGAGLWTVVSFADEAARDRWLDPIKAAFRWLADSGFGGERSRGWGRSEAPEFTEGQMPNMILDVGQVSRLPVGPAHWLLSLFAPSPGGFSRLGTRQLHGDGARRPYRQSGGLRRIEEIHSDGRGGFVLYSSATLRGAAPDVAPEGFAHPVFRAGFAVSIPLPEGN